jgi:hypothetical protein
MMRDQIEMLSNFLSKTGIVNNMKVLQAYLTHWRQYAWEEVFRYNFVFEVEQNITLGVSICLDCVLIETLDLDTGRELVSAVEKISTLSKS